LLGCDLHKISGIGEKAIEALKRLSIENIYDLLFHFPTSVTYKVINPPIYSIRDGETVVLNLQVIDIDQPNNPHISRSRSFKIHCLNETGRISLVYFNYYPQYLLNWIKIGSKVIVVGKAEFFKAMVQIAHPEVINPQKKDININIESPIYPLTYGITSKQLHKYVNQALEIDNIDYEWIDDSIMQKFGWIGFKESLKKIHNPKSNIDVNPSSIYRQRIAYDELLSHQLVVNSLRKYKNNHIGRKFVVEGNLLQSFISQLPFELTNGQKAAIDEIKTNQQSEHKMSRLLQGDVGSGKTVVALAAMLNVVESKAQCVLMAPTDILATQHFTTAKKLLNNLSVECALLTGKTKTKERILIDEALKNGSIQILFGTHAVFQEKISFFDLALVVIDEQHRFGVEQRMRLLDKGNNADLLVMSATPIPRSLSLALYGDMDITELNEKPKSRIAIKTSILSSNKLNDVIGSIKNILQQGEKIYWICPLVNEDENSLSTKTAVEIRYQELSKFYPGVVGLLHGKLDSHIKQENLHKFMQGEHKILVATTVIEVGVDVPDATVIIIENAESFGLSQLHQLRGRVGRGDKASNCILLYKAPISSNSWERLKILRETEDGFKLAKKDLELRGGGDLIGTKQSGMPNFKVVDLIIHNDLVTIADKQAKYILANLSDLRSSTKYQKLLSIFSMFNKEQTWLK
jgi:ATP-dependent DNA helicase RecG